MSIPSAYFAVLGVQTGWTSSLKFSKTLNGDDRQQFHRARENLQELDLAGQMNTLATALKQPLKTPTREQVGDKASLHSIAAADQLP